MRRKTASTFHTHC